MAGAMKAQAWDLGDLSKLTSEAEILAAEQRGRDSMQAEILAAAEQRGIQIGKEQRDKEVAPTLIKLTERIKELERLLPENSRGDR